MKLYQWDIRLLSGSLTPWQSDTIFGHVCWAIAEQEGPERLRDILDMCLNGDPPFVFSDGFPSGFLPMPCGDLMQAGMTSSCKADALDAMKKAKKIRRMRYLPRSVFQDLLSGKTVSYNELSEPEITTYSIVHNTIDRHMGVTLKGGLFSEIESWTERITVFILIKDGWESKTETLLEQIELKGYGAKVSRGKGNFKTIEFRLAENLAAPIKPNGFLILSHCLPTADMPPAAQYHINIKHGKLGANIETENPFKRPIIMLEPGAVFWTAEMIKPWYGRVAQHIHAQYPDAVQNGMAIALPCDIKPPKALEELYADCF